MVLEHFTQVAAAVTIPLYVYNAPDENAGSKIGAVANPNGRKPCD